MAFSSVIGVFLIVGLMALLAFRFYVRRPLPQFELPLALPGVLGGAEGSVLVFAPHSDDETLGAGGVISDTLAAGGRVKVVLMTNGDGFSAAAEDQLRTGRLAPERFVELGYIRQDETVAALRALGLDRKDVIFLGYPDRGLGPMWEQYWDYATPYTSPYTGASRSPYRNSFEIQATYCGQGVVDNLKKIITAFGPTQIVVSHPSDAHPDHRATFALVTYALEQLRDEGYASGHRVPVYTYLVHCGGWPVPRGYHPTEPLDAPRSLRGLTTQWYEYELHKASVEKKRQAVEAYKSQTSLLPLFLKSFVRSSELFGVLREVAATSFGPGPDTSNPAVGQNGRWWGVNPVILDPLGDTALRRVEPAGDLRAVSAVVDGQDLHLLVKARGQSSPTVEYVIYLSDFGLGHGSGGGPGDGRARTFYRLATTASGPVRVAVNGSTEDARADRLRRGAAVLMSGGGLEVRVPLEAIGRPARIMLAAQAHVEKTVIDSTEWTVVGLP